MALDTRSQDLKWLEDSLESDKDQAQKYEHMVKILDSYNKKLENTTSNHEVRLDELKDLISGLSYQQISILQTLQ